MATPRAARHRDLEQRIRDLEAQVRALTSATLRREQLKVDEGDFVVSGGGGVVVKDGGYVEVDHPNGITNVWAGPIIEDSETEAYQGSGLLVQDEDGKDIATFRTDVQGGGQWHLYDKQGNVLLADDGTSGFGLALPHLDIPMQLDTGTLEVATTTNSGWTSMYFGTFTVVSPYLDLSCYAYSNSSTDCRARFTIDGSNSAAGGAAQDAKAGSGAVGMSWRVDLTGYDFGSTHELRLECRAINGSQAVGVMPYGVRTGQS